MCGTSVADLFTVLKMKKAYLIRDEIRNDCIRGLLVGGGEIFHTLENPWQKNKANVSCICSGEYLAQYLERSSSGKYRDVYWLQGVPDRTGILIHSGNTAAHTKGCILIGKRRGQLASKPAILNSRTALGEFVDLMERETFKIIVIGGQQC